MVENAEMARGMMKKFVMKETLMGIITIATQAVMDGALGAETE